MADSIAAQPDDDSLNVCLLHVGEEYACQPTDEVTALVTRLIDAGADAVICSHPHVVQRSEVMTTAAGNSGLVSHTSYGTTCVYRLDEYDADLAHKHMANVYEPDSITFENLYA